MENKRTISAIKKKARIFNLIYSRKHIFLQHEEEYILKNYLVKTQQEIASYLNISIRHLQSFLYEKGLNKKEKWSKEEIEILKTYYPIEGRKCKERLKSKSLHSIYKKVQKLNIKGIGTRRKIRCIELGTIYESAEEAARDISNLESKSGSTIIGCCRGRKKTFYGYHWEYVE